MRKKMTKRLNKKFRFLRHFVNFLSQNIIILCQNIRFLSSFCQKSVFFCYKTTNLGRNLKVEDTSSVTKIITALIHGNPEVEDARGELLVVF